MKIVITAAGASNRFAKAGYDKPKFMLPLGSISILEYVLNMFDISDQFLVIVTNETKIKHKQYLSEIQHKYRNLIFYAIESHEFGPCYSVIQEFIEFWVADDPFIISYCDFYVTWDYKSYRKFIENTNPDANLVTFRDFQPASRGRTLFAYCRTFGTDVLEIKEKESFTEKRESEFASTGIYYFRNWKIFVECVESSQNEFLKLGEQYVSLVFNSAIQKNLLVNHYQAKKFICLGTPEDYEEYLYWLNFFSKLNKEKNSKSKYLMTNLITMAGLGERFKKIGINVQKPFIPIRNIPMFIHAANSNPGAIENIFVVRSQMKAKTELALATYSTKGKIIEINDITSGPGETILLVKDKLNSDSSVLVLSCDYEHSINEQQLEKFIHDETFVAGVFYTKYSPYRMKSATAFAYAHLHKNNEVIKIVEKELLSSTPENDALLVGTFWFRSSRILIDTLNQAKNNQRLINGELYVANAMNILLENGYKIFALPVDYWISYGDPEELEIYNWWEEVLESI